MMNSGIPSATIKHVRYFDETSKQFRVRGNPQGNVPSGVLVTAKATEDTFTFRVNSTRNDATFYTNQKGVWNDREVLSSANGEVVRPKDGVIQEDEVVMFSDLPGTLHRDRVNGLTKLTSAVEYSFDDGGITEQLQYIIR